MRIGEILNAVYDRSVGWRPATGALKPVHIANGLFRDLTGEYFDTKRIVHFLIPWKKKNDPQADPKRTYQYLVEEAPSERYTAFQGGGQQRDRFERLREYTRGVLAADGAVFPKPTDSSLTLTCRQMISSDRFDKHVGRFAADILRGQDGAGTLAQHLKGCLKRGSETPVDPLTFLAWPLLSRDAEPVSQRSARTRPTENKRLKEFFTSLEHGAAALASHEASQGNRLATLQRAVHFSVLALLGHAQVLAVNGSIGKRVPLLVAMDAPKGSRLARASEESLIRYYDAFDGWLATQLGVRLTKEQPLIYTSDADSTQEEAMPPIPTLRRDSVEKWLKNIRTDKDEVPSADALTDRICLYEQALSKVGKDDPGLLLGETLVQCYRHEYSSGGPRQFLSGVGRKAGVIFPHFQGRSKEKRVRPSVAILDVLVKSCTPVGEPIPIHDFLETLWTRFGIIVGGRVADTGGDHELLATHGIDVSQGDLNVGTAAFIDQLVQIGLARRYPDNITYVGTYNA
jgi:hypothetical protein